MKQTLSVTQQYRSSYHSVFISNGVNERDVSSLFRFRFRFLSLSLSLSRMKNMKMIPIETKISILTPNHLNKTF